MKLKVLLPTGIVVVTVITIWLFTAQKEYRKIDGRVQGTTYHIIYEYKKNVELQPEIDTLLKAFDLTFSTFNPNSIISRINRNDTNVEVNDQFIEVFNKSVEINKITLGAFDITVGPIVNAMGFGPSRAIAIDSSIVDSLLQYVGMSKVRIINRKLMKDHPSVILDVNAIAQGYSVDLVSRFLDKKKSKNYLIEIGGELRAKGVNFKGETWKIGIDKPVEGNMEQGKILQAILALKDKSLATSGNYRKFYVKNGIKYSHIINPKTGYSALSPLLSTTVLAGDCITADAYATALMILGLDKSMAFLSEHNELAAFLIYNDSLGNYKVYATENMKEYIFKEIQ